MPALEWRPARRKDNTIKGALALSESNPVIDFGAIVEKLGVKADKQAGSGYFGSQSLNRDSLSRIRDCTRTVCLSGFGSQLITGAGGIPGECIRFDPVEIQHIDANRFRCLFYLIARRTFLIWIENIFQFPFGQLAISLQILFHCRILFHAHFHRLFS
jgi:hypothetical protein